MPKYAHAELLDGGSDVLRARAATADRVKLHVLKTYAAGDSFATATGNSCGSISLVAGDIVQSGADGAARTTTFAAKNITLTANSAQYDAGTATAGAAGTLTDTGKAWGVNAQANRAVVIIAGTGAGQSRRIASNTATVLTVSSNWVTPPDATSQYAIRDDTHVVVTDETGSKVLYAAEETANQQLSSGNTFNCPAFTYQVGQPT